MANSRDPALVDTFCQEVEQQVKVLNEGLLALESQNDPQAIESLMRAAHSVKGAAKMLELQSVVDLAHQMESCFVCINSELQTRDLQTRDLQNPSTAIDSADLDRLFQGVDWLDNLHRRSPDQVMPWIETQAEVLATLQNSLQQLWQALGGDSPRASTLMPRSPSSLAASETTTTAETAADRVVRVSADNLHRIIGLAGESLVDANWLQPFADSLGLVKLQQQELSRILEHLERELTQQGQTSPQLKALIQTARRQEQDCYDLLDDRLGELELYVRRSLNLSDRLYREVIHAHMRPFSDGIEGFPRMVRDLSRELNKQVRFEVLGKATAVDRDILNKLEAPLTHILRNAVDHGIEPVNDRLAQGKPPYGTVRMEALHRGGMLVITISDDGKGIDLEELRQTVQARGLVPRDMGPQLSETELLDFLFLPGFSTATQVTEVSGRGVGLDVAKTMAQQVGGRVQVTTQKGQGSRFHFQLPLTLSVVRALLVQIGGETYAFPLARVDQIVQVSLQEIYQVEGRPFFTKDDQNIGLVPAHLVLELPPTPVPSEELAVVVIQEGGRSYGVVVEQFLGEEDLVVRPLDPRLGRIRDISAVALLRDGSPVLIIDGVELVRSIDQHLRTNLSLNVTLQSRPVLAQGQCVLVVDDSPTVRATETRLLQQHHYEVHQAASGVEAWEALLQHNYDLLITDVDMPGMNGLDLLRQVRSHPKLQSLPVIMVSYRDREEDRQQGLRAGANFYLTKSNFQDDTLIKAVRSLLRTTGA
ncbi:MAG: hybrid sensor histidine kinase/response regulator [Prochlorotrichaceae cyanobacterium]